MIAPTKTRLATKDVRAVIRPVIRRWRDRAARFAVRLDTYLIRSRLIVYPITTLVLFVVAVIWTWWARGTRPLPDFASRWTAGHMIVNGQTSALYDPVAQAALQQELLGGSSLSLFVSPPFVALLFAPLGALPYPLACALWAAISVGSIALSFVLLRRLVRPGSPISRGFTILPILASYPLLELVGAGQDTGIVLLTVSAGVWLLHSHRDALAGTVLALGLIKPHLVFLVPVVLLCQGRYRALVAFGVSAVSVAGVCVGVAGWSGGASWVDLVLGNEYADVVQRGQAWKSASLPGAVNSMLPPGSSRLWDLAGLALGIVVIVLSVAAFRRRHDSTLTTWGFAAAAMCLTSPHAMVYDLVLVVPALFALADVAWGPVARAMLTAWSLALFLVAPIHALVGGASWPASILGAPWHVVFLVWLWRTLRRKARDANATHLEERVASVRGPKGEDPPGHSGA